MWNHSAVHLVLNVAAVVTASEQENSLHCSDSDAQLSACLNGGSCVIVTVDGQRKPSCRFSLVYDGIN